MGAAWCVVIDRTVDPFDPRTPLVIGPFRSQDTATIKAATIIRMFERHGLDRGVETVPLDEGKTAVRTIIEDAQ